MTYVDTLFDASNRVGGKADCEYYVLHRKKHQRTICFRDTPEAIEFIKPKFRHSILKRVFHWLITIGAHRWFSDTIVLSRRMGDVIYIANSIKSFDLKEEKVLVFKDSEKDLFIDVKLKLFLAEFQFAAKVLELNQKGLFYKEELLYDSELDVDDILRRLAEFHSLTKYKYIHGDFVRDHIKVDKEGNIKFIDWMIREGNGQEDIVNFAERSQ